MAWTEQRKATATELWLAGKSASEIARAIGDTTRNAVIGMIHRAKLAARVTPTRPSHTLRQRPPRVRKLTPQRYKPMREEPPAPIEPLNTSILEVSDFQCKAVVDQTEWGRALCCGHPAEVGRSFCRAHEAMFFTMQDRRSKAA